MLEGLAGEKGGDGIAVARTFLRGPLAHEGEIVLHVGIARERGVIRVFDDLAGQYTGRDIEPGRLQRAIDAAARAADDAQGIPFEFGGLADREGGELRRAEHDERIGAARLERDYL